MNNVSICGTLNTNKLNKHSLRLLLPLIFASWCLPYDSSSIKLTYFDSVFHWEIFWWNLPPCSSETAPMFSGKFQMGIQKMKFQWHVNTPRHCMMKLALEIFHCRFPLFSLPINFLQTFLNAIQALLPAEFNFVLKSWSSNCCFICGPTKILSFILAAIILESFCLK